MCFLAVGYTCILYITSAVHRLSISCKAELLHHAAKKATMMTRDVNLTAVFFRMTTDTKAVWINREFSQRSVDSVSDLQLVLWLTL